MGKEKTTANTVKDSTEKNQGKVSVKATANIVSERVTTPKKGKGYGYRYAYRYPYYLRGH